MADKTKDTFQRISMGRMDRLITPPPPIIAVSVPSFFPVFWFVFPVFWFVFSRFVLTFNEDMNTCPQSVIIVHGLDA